MDEGLMGIFQAILGMDHGDDDEEGFDEDAFKLFLQEAEKEGISFTSQDDFIDSLLAIGFGPEDFSEEELASLWLLIEEEPLDKEEEEEFGVIELGVGPTEELSADSDDIFSGSANGVTFGSLPYFEDQGYSGPPELQYEFPPYGVGNFHSHSSPYGGIPFTGYYLDDTSYYYETTGEVYDTVTGYYLYSY